MDISTRLSEVLFSLKKEEKGEKSHKKHDNDPEIETPFWESNEKISANIPKNPLKKKMEHMISTGIPEFEIIKNILPDIIDNQDVSLLSEFVKYFSELPEKYLAKIIKFLVELQPSKNEKCNLILSIILGKSFNNVTLQSYLYSFLSLNDIVTILRSIKDVILCEKYKKYLVEEKILQWCCVFVELIFQKSILLRDENLVEILQEVTTIFHNNDTTSSLSNLQYQKSDTYEKYNIVTCNSEYVVDQILLY